MLRETGHAAYPPVNPSRSTGKSKAATTINREEPPSSPPGSCRSEQLEMLLPQSNRSRERNPFSELAMRDHESSLPVHIAVYSKLSCGIAVFARSKTELFSRLREQVVLRENSSLVHLFPEPPSRNLNSNSLLLCNYLPLPPPRPPYPPVKKHDYSEKRQSQANLTRKR